MDPQHIMAMQTQILQSIAQNLAALNPQHHPAPHHNGRSKLTDFLRTHPPEFSQTTEPVEVDDWLKDVEWKLDLVQCSPREKALYAAHQLRGPAANWWENYCAAHRDAANIVWVEFAEAFRAAYVPESIYDIKREEFNNLKQGNSSINEYLSKFNHLARYATDEVDIDKKKIRKFLKGMNVGIKLQLVAHVFPTFQDMVNRALIVEDTRKEVEIFRKRKMAQTGFQSHGGPCPRTNSSPQFRQPAPQ